MSMNTYIYALIILFGLFLNQNTNAQSMWGSGMYQGGMICPYQPKTSKAAVNISDEEKEERKKIASLKADVKLKGNERKRAESQLEYLRKKIERFFEPEVATFLMETHIENAKKCDDYKTAHSRCTPQTGATISSDDKVFCDGLSEPPSLLTQKWNGKDAAGKGGYCAGGNEKRSAGSVSSSICSDSSLRPSDGPKYRTYNTSECSKALADYRKQRIAAASAADKEERALQEMEDRQYAISDIRERARIEREYSQRQTESDCDDCDKASRGYRYEKPDRDWVSTAVNVVGGLGMMYLGKKTEQAANEYNAQAGWPSSQSYGYPFYQAGLSGVINGLTGPGAYGCSSTSGGGGFPYGAGGGWGLGGAANGAFGPFGASGGAFGYPPNMYGSPWGGGAYMPGFGPGGQVNGPFGGFNIGGGFGFPGNGMMCIQAPCPGGSMGGQFGMPPFGGQFGGGLGGQFGMPPFGGQFGGGLGGQFGMPPFGGQFGGGLGGQFGMPPFGGQFGGQFGGNPLMGNPYGGVQMSGQYQMQMMQQQQQMMQQQQQYYQQQMQQQQQMMQQSYQRQQQSMQIQMQIQQLNMQLQMLQQQSYYGGSPGFGFGFNVGVGVGGGGYPGYPGVGVGGGGAPVPGGMPPGGGPMYPGGSPGFYPPTNPYPGTSFPPPPGGTVPGGGTPPPRGR